jgi:hypothetical protein
MAYMEEIEEIRDLLTEIDDDFSVVSDYETQIEDVTTDPSTLKEFTDDEITPEEFIKDCTKCIANNKININKKLDEIQEKINELRTLLVE